MKLILTIALFIPFSLAIAQENPWAIKQNTLENPWLTEEEKKELLEQEKLCSQERVQEEQRLLEANIKMKKIVEYKSLNSDTLTIDEKVNQLVKNGINVYDEGLRDGLEYYDASGYGVGAFFITLFPLAGNPIVWIIASGKPNDSELQNSNNTQNDLLKNKEYKDGYKVGARKKRAGKMMFTNLISNACKIIIYVKIILR